MASNLTFACLLAWLCIQLVGAQLIRGSLNPTLYYGNQTSRELAGVTYCPGDFSERKKSTDGMIHTSNGMTCKRIATSGEKVELANGKLSTERFHAMPDGAATYMKKDGGWYYISNAEVDKAGTSWDDGVSLHLLLWYDSSRAIRISHRIFAHWQGVGRIEFDKNGKVIGYKKIANKMRKNWYVGCLIVAFYIGAHLA